MARLHQMLIVFYPDSVDENTILANFANDTNIDKAAYVTDEDFTPGLPVTSTTKSLNKEIKTNQGIGTNFLSDLNINSAWDLSEGMGYIVALDLGVQTDHPDIRAFNGAGTYTGGNLLDAFFQIDFGNGDLNVDAKEPTDTCVDVSGSCTNPFHASLEPCDLEDGINDDLASIGFIGHGTHVTGIMTGENNSIGGICKNCGMSMFKTSRFDFCINYNGVNTLFPAIPDSSVANALMTAAQIGNGTINLSAGRPDLFGTFCNNDGTGMCLAVDFIKEQNVMLVAAAGNSRTVSTFPASEAGVVAVGGLSEDLKFWNESPNNGNIFDFSITTDCPRFPRLDECGSNVSQSAINRKIDVSTQARMVKSTFYFGEEWADDIGCTDFQDGVIDGYGNCTGTSMSTPQVASIMQLMRSTHPLLPNGTFDPALTTGLINILNASATHSDATIAPGQNNFYGYGLPDARTALEKILGKSNGVQIKTRLTPMFNMVSTGANNNVYTPFPQIAAAFLLTNVSPYLPDVSKPLVNEFTEFWYADTLTFPPPRAEFYVFTTNNNPFTGVKNMTPLRRMEKTVGGNRNDTYAVSDAEIQSFHNDGYNLAGIEGYILAANQCIPTCIGATKLYRDESDSLNHKLVPTNTAPPSSTLLGFVYLNNDTDGDGLIDGQEIILGTNINVQDTDGDTIPDGVEYPPAGVPVSDPRTSDTIFENGFE